MQTLLIGKDADRIKFASVSAAALGSNTLVAAVTGKRIRVMALHLVAAGAVTVQLLRAATALSGIESLAANGDLTLPFSMAGWTVTAVGEALNMSLGSAVQVSGMIAYVEETADETIRGNL